MNTFRSVSKSECVVDVEVEVIDSNSDAVLLDNGAVRRWVNRAKIIDSDGPLNKGQKLIATMSIRTAADGGFV